MSNCTKAIMYGILTLLIFWVSGFLPEHYGWVILPMDGAQPVWFGFHYSITVLLTIGVTASIFAKFMHACMDEIDV